MKRLIALSVAAISTVALGGPGSMAYSTKDLNDEVRASIAKEMSKAKQFKDDRKDGDGTDDGTVSGGGVLAGRTSSNCQMDVGSVEKPRPGTRAPSRTITVVQGNIIQLCGK